METTRLRFRKWRVSDAADLFEYARDPDVGPIAGWQPHRSEEHSLRVINEIFLPSPEAYAICLKGDDRPIGAIELFMGGHSDAGIAADEYELGFWLAKPFWGRGLMTEAAKEMIRHAFVDLGAATIWCAYYADNARSARVQEKCGFAFVKKNDAVYVKAMDEYRVCYINRLDKEDWEKSVR